MKLKIYRVITSQAKINWCMIEPRTFDSSALISGEKYKKKTYIRDRNFKKKIEKMAKSQYKGMPSYVRPYGKYSKSSISGHL